MYENRDFYLVKLFCVAISVAHVTSQGYPKIPGPKSLDDRIAIIGAGPSGIHMAYELKKRGFNNIVVFERTHEIGGKSHSRWYRGAWQEFGTTMLLERYDSIVDLMKKFNVGFKITPYTLFDQWVNHTYYTSAQGILAMQRPDLTPRQLLQEYTQAVYRYSKLHKDLFGNYEGEIMPRPNSTTLRMIRGTIKEFLDRNQLSILSQIFTNYFTGAAYGKINEEPALYGLMYMTPSLLRSINTTPNRGIWMFQGGFQNLWREIARQSNVEIRFEVDIKRMERRRGPRGVSIIYSKRKSPNVNLRESFDFLVLSPAMHSLIGIVDFNPIETTIFQTLRHQYYVTTLVDSSYGMRGPNPTKTMIQNLHNYEYNNGDYEVVVGIDFYGAANNLTGIDYQTGKTRSGNDLLPRESVIYYQIGQANPWNPLVENVIQRKMKDHLDKFQKENPKVIKRVKFSYYGSKFPPREIERGFLWNVLEMQGLFKTWYIGSSVSFDTSESVIEYNKLILRNAILPTK